MGTLESDTATITGTGKAMVEEYRNLEKPGHTGSLNSKQVFVIHGRNEVLRKDFFSLLRAFGLEPLEWSEAIGMTGQGSPYVGEVLNVALGSAQAVVVLMSPDDEAKLRDDFLSKSDPNHERILTPQARPNVLFEAGLSMGRDADRTILVEVGRLRPFSDIVGRHTIRLDNSTEKRQEVANRLKTAGCDVNLLGKTDWQTLGNFEIPETVSKVPERDSTPPSTNQENDLHEEQVSILLELSKHQRRNATELTEVLNIPGTRVQYHIDRLLEYSYVHVAPILGKRFPVYQLRPKGRAWLFERELI